MLDRIQSQLTALHLTYPFTEEELKHAYCTRSFETHPDVCKSDGKEFIAVKEAYDTLLPLCVLASEKIDLSTRTVEGQSIFDLGKGLGYLVNSTDCSECQGKGWSETVHFTYDHDEHVCSVCGGKGEIKTVHNYDFTSHLWWKNWRPCRKCFGLGYTGETKTIEHKTKHTCIHCNGTGQIEIFNPVLWKNRTGGYLKQTNKSNGKKYCSCGARLIGEKCWRCP